MRTWRAAGLILAAAALAQGAGAAENQLTAEERQAGWRLLFDGRTLDGWGITGRHEGWVVEDDAIACTVRGGGCIHTHEQWADFTLSVDFKTAPRVNSGVFLRWEDLKDPVNSAMEIQILDSFGRVPPDKHDCGALYDLVAPTVDAARPAGEWNRMVVDCWGPIVRVTLNGTVIVHANLSQWTTAGRNPDGSRNKFERAYATMLQPGRIGFQDHGGRVWYRNIKLRPLPPYRPPVGG